ncbi:MAG: hypothetical protein AABX79_02415 [Nanoarchaeota archaeon]
MKKKTGYLIITLAAILVIVNTLFLFYLGDFDFPDFTKKENVDDQKVNASEFSDVVDNRYFTLTPGTKYVYEGDTEDGLERTETYVTEEKRTVNGIETTVVWDRVWLEDELIEETYDWYAQDKEGNVWYFGENSTEYENGKVSSTKGSWEAGVDGAEAGIIMKANPVVGDKYKQEYYKGVAEDMAEIVSLGEIVETKYETFSDCLKTKDWNPLESGSGEYKYYCPATGNVVLEIVIETDEQVELIDIVTY